MTLSEYIFFYFFLTTVAAYLYNTVLHLLREKILLLQRGWQETPLKWAGIIDFGPIPTYVKSTYCCELEKRGIFFLLFPSVTTYVCVHVCEFRWVCKKQQDGSFCSRRRKYAKTRRNKIPSTFIDDSKWRALWVCDVYFAYEKRHLGKTCLDIRGNAQKTNSNQSRY